MKQKQIKLVPAVLRKIMIRIIAATVGGTSVASAEESQPYDSLEKYLTSAEAAHSALARREFVGSGIAAATGVIGGAIILGTLPSRSDESAGFGRTIGGVVAYSTMLTGVGVGLGLLTSGLTDRSRAREFKEIRLDYQSKKISSSEAEARFKSTVHSIQRNRLILAGLELATAGAVIAWTAPGKWREQGLILSAPFLFLGTWNVFTNSYAADSLKAYTQEQDAKKKPNLSVFVTPLPEDGLSAGVTLKF